MEIGKIRRFGIRLVFFLTFIALAPSAWQEILAPKQVLEPFYGVTVSFWSALAGLSVLGLFYPVKMLPLLLLQWAYKLIWLLGVGLPLWQQGLLEGSAKELALANGIGALLDTLVIPWLYVARSYLRKPSW